MKSRWPDHALPAALVCGMVAGLVCAVMARPEMVSLLYTRGYTVIPEPQQAKLGEGDFQIAAGWRVEAGPGVTPRDVAIGTLKEGLQERYGLKLGDHGSGPGIRLEIQSNAVPVGEAQDRDKAALADQAYKLSLTKNAITIVANAPTGLFYGVETLVQLVKPSGGSLWLPEAELVDWPDVQYREVFWDEQTHLDRFEVLKDAVRRAAFFKINAFALRLNAHFEYSSAPALVDPYALSPAQLQELTDYGLHYHVQVVPYLDGPAHVNFILERDEYAKLREFPETAFQMCSTNPETYKLLEGMYQDLMDANKGGKYFHLSTDEAWFIGKASNDQCHEAERAKELGSLSKLWTEYTNKTAAYLRDHGRKVIFWGEDPLQAEDIPLLPPWLISGEVYSSAYNRAFRARGIRQMIYTNSQPDDPLFPAYFVLSPKEQVHPGEGAQERAAEVFDEITYTAARKEADIMGVDIFAWGDRGPHPETFWLGYAVGASAAWHPGSPDPHELTQSFYRLFYGTGATQMGRLHQLMSTQAQFWASSWDHEPSGKQPLVFGYSYGLGPFTPHLETLPLPPVPSADYLRVGDNWRQENARRLELSEKFLGENDELLDLLYKNLPSVQFHRNNLEVYLSIARLCRQNLLMLRDLEEVVKDLEAGEDRAAKLQYADAVAALDQALDRAGKIRDERNQALRDATTTWYKTWFPRVREANGRHVARAPQDFVDTQPSERARRGQEGLVYLIDREFSLPFGEWVNEVQRVRNRYATAHGLPARERKFDWQDTETLHSQAVDREL
jgi:hexosaminidase